MAGVGKLRPVGRMPEYIMQPVMRIKTSKLVPQFKNIIQNCEQLHSSQ